MTQPLSENNTETTSETSSVSPSAKEEPKEQMKTPENTTDGQTEFDNIKAMFNEKLAYRDLLQAHGSEESIIDEIAFNILKMYFSKPVTIKEVQKPKPLIWSALMRLTYWHIERLLFKYKSVRLPYG